jgi:UDP-2,3-diacylglucosamine pyrophosphatase LpxH
MRVALVSDVHLAGPDDPVHARFIRWIEDLRVDRLCLCGDVFQHWWHFGAEPFPQYRPVVDALRRSGIPLVVLPGNHDFHAPAFFTEAVTGEVVREEWDGLRVHLAHGDHVDRSPGYRAMSAILRGRAFAALVDTLGPTRAWSFLGRLGGRGDVPSDPTLVAAQVADARNVLAAGRDLVVYGHTHAPGVHHVPEGIHVNLGDWVTHRTWLLVEDGSVSLRSA